MAKTLDKIRLEYAIIYSHTKVCSHGRKWSEKMLLAFELINKDDPDGICEFSGYALNETDIFNQLRVFFHDCNYNKTFEGYSNINKRISRYSIIHWYDDIKMKEYYDLFVYETKTMLV